MTVRNPPAAWGLIKRIQREFHLCRGRDIIFLTLGSFIIMVFELIGVSALLPLSSLIMAPDATMQSPFYQNLQNFLGAHDARGLVTWVGASIAGIFIIKGVLNIFYWRYEFNVLSRWRLIITDKLYRTYLDSDYLYFIKTSSAQIMNNITQSVPIITNNFIHQFIALFNNVLMAILLLCFMFTVNFMICFLLLVTGLLLIGLHHFFQEKATQKLGQDIHDLTMQQTRLLQNSIAGYKETKLHNKEEIFATGYLKVAKNLARKDIDFLFVKNLPTITVEMAIMVLVVLIFISMLYFNDAASTISAQLGVLTILSFRMIPIVNRIIASTSLIDSSIGALQGIFDDLDKAKKMPAPLHNAEGSIEIPGLKNGVELHIQLDHFTYPDTEDPAIHSIDISIKEGEFIGLTGPSGGGKSTLIHILLGFITGFRGRYTINNVVLDRGNIASLRHVLGFVDQTIFVTEGTIAENIAFGETTDAIDRVRAQHALEKAQLWGFVDTLPNGMDTQVGEHGNQLSGGQKQRLAIARCFYRDVRFLILDEASASLDVETERDFFDYLATLKGQITVVMIAHRLSTLKSCDRILFMQDGTVASSGTFNTLYQSNQTFKKYVDYSNIDIQR